MQNSIFRRTEEEKFKKEGRLPPGQALTQKFPVLHYGPVPQFDPENWDIKVWGEVELPFSLNWKAFNELPKTSLTMDIHCVTRWSKFDTQWQGVSVKTLVEAGLLKIKPSARFVLQHAEFGFSANLPLEIVMADNFLMATHYEGVPITPDHGFPLRGVVGAVQEKKELTVPYFWKGAKWLRGLEFLADDNPGFWEQAGYHNRGDVWKEERFE